MGKTETLNLSLLPSCIHEYRSSAVQQQFFRHISRLLALRDMSPECPNQLFSLEACISCVPSPHVHTLPGKEDFMKDAAALGSDSWWRYKSYHEQICQIVKLLSLNTVGLQPAIFILLVGKWLLQPPSSERNTGQGDPSPQRIISSLARTFVLLLIYMILATFRILLISKEISKHGHKLLKWNQAVAG